MGKVINNLEVPQTHGGLCLLVLILSDDYYFKGFLIYFVDLKLMVHYYTLIAINCKHQIRANGK